MIVAGVTCPNFGRMLGHSRVICRPAYAHLAHFARYARYSRGALLVKRAIFQGRRMSRSASPPLLQQLAPLAKAAPLDSQQNTLLN